MLSLTFLKTKGVTMASKQSIRRSMLWSAYGDALGFITEMHSTNMSNEGILRRRTGSAVRVIHLIPWVRRVGGEFGVAVRLMAGCYSDDTQLRLSTCRSIRGDGVFDVETFSKVEIPVWTSYALGAGRGTKTAAESLRRSDTQWNSNFFKSQYAYYLDSGGNGAAMRIQPHVWCAPEQKPNSLIIRDVVRNTITTHGHIRAIIGAAFHALCLQHALLKTSVPGPNEWLLFLEQLSLIPKVIRSDGELLLHWLPNWEEEIKQSIDEATNRSIKELRQDMMVAQRNLENPRAFNDKGKGYLQLVEQIGCLQKDSVGSAVKTALLAAYLSCAFSDQPYEALVEAVNILGSDTDTISTMTGAILGAVAKADPPETVADAEYLEKEAERLYELSQGQATTSYDYPDLLYWQPPKSQLDALGYHEGKWFVQGLGEANPVGDPIERGGKYPVVWQWFKLKFGQSVLMKRRRVVKSIPKSSVPVKPETADVRSRQRERAADIAKPAWDKSLPAQPKLWNVDRHIIHREKLEITIDMAVEQCARSGWKADLVGTMLLRLAEQEDGVEKAVAFAAIVAKSRRAHTKKDSAPNP